LALAGAAVKKIFSVGLDALGWIGIAISLGILVVVVAVLAGKRTEPPEPTSEQPTSPAAPIP
jgi:hypothetical protein